MEILELCATRTRPLSVGKFLKIIRVFKNAQEFYY